MLMYMIIPPYVVYKKFENNVGDSYYMYDVGDWVKECMMLVR